MEDKDKPAEIIAPKQTHSKELELRTVENVMEDNYLRYSMSVIVARALPDVRDGLKPVHRRILYTILERGTASYRQNGYNEKTGEPDYSKYFSPTPLKTLLVGIYAANVK